MDLLDMVRAQKGDGVIWTLEQGSDLNVNLVRFSTGGVGEHVNDELDVLLVGVAGAGHVTLEREEHRLEPGKMVFIPKAARRSVRSISEDFAYLSVHRRRQPLRIGRRETQGA